MYLRELFDKPVAYEWTYKDDYQWVAEFDIEKVHYEFIADIINPYPEDDEEVEAVIEFFHRTERGVPTHKISGVGRDPPSTHQRKKKFFSNKKFSYLNTSSSI